jgi:SsrA-binding protein
MSRPESELVVARNRRARRDYHLEDSRDAGIVLVGPEVKALRAGRASLVDGFADVEDGEIWLHQVHIPQYTPATWTNVASRRKRKLLHRSEIDKIQRRVEERGLTIVPLSLYFKGRPGPGGDRVAPWQEDLGQAARTGGAASGARDRAGGRTRLKGMRH